MQDYRENLTFLKARDPSILAWNRPPMVAMDLNSQFSEESITSSVASTEVKKVDHLQVYLRIKPSKDLNELYEIKSEQTLICLVPPGSQAYRNVQDGRRIKKKFTFSKIYNTDASQTAVFDDCVRERILDFINGKNCTLFTYGTSGSGKTFTILGTATNPGIIPRSLEYMFRTLPEINDMPRVKPKASGEVIVLDSIASRNECEIRSKILNASTNVIDRSVHIKTYKTMQERLSVEQTPGTLFDDSTIGVSIGVWVTFAEIYNEYIYDLLQPEPARGKQRTKLRLGSDNKGNTYIKDLTHISVSSGLQAYEILQYGMHNLNYASTSVNAHSSRSHCIFTIKLAQVIGNGSKVQISYFNFCDLAGSERAKNTCNVGERLKESNNINTSLHVLGRCIKSLRESQKNEKSNDSKIIVPFRESKLTRLFQTALSGQESISMIVNVNANREMFDESQHVLNFSAIAKNISVEHDVKPTKVAVNARFSEYIQSRSTALPTISNCEASEIEILRNQNSCLLMELERMQHLQREKEEKARQDVKDLLQKRINEIYAENSVMMKKQEKMYEERINRYEIELHEMRNNAKRQRMSNVICLDDSSIEEIENMKSELALKTENLNKMQSSYDEILAKNASLQADKTRLCFELTAANNDSDKKTIIELQHQLNEKQQTILLLQSLVNDAEKEYKQLEDMNKNLEKENEEKTCEVLNLYKEVSDLNAQLAAQSEALAERRECVEELEDRLRDIEYSKNETALITDN